MLDGRAAGDAGRHAQGKAFLDQQPTHVPLLTFPCLCLCQVLHGEVFKIHSKRSASSTTRKYTQLADMAAHDVYEAASKAVHVPAVTGKLAASPPPPLDVTANAPDAPPSYPDSLKSADDVETIPLSMKLVPPAMPADMTDEQIAAHPGTPQVVREV